MTDRRSRLAKRHVERLLRDYDDDPVAALTVALRIVLGRPRAEWLDLIASAGFDAERCRALAAGDVDALDDLLADLNEQRQLFI